MTAINIVRFRVRPGMEQAFLDAHRNDNAAWPGLSSGHIVEVGARTYVLIEQWPDAAVLASARKPMIETLARFATPLRIWDRAST